MCSLEIQYTKIGLNLTASFCNYLVNANVTLISSPYLVRDLLTFNCFVVKGMCSFHCFKQTGNETNIFGLENGDMRLKFSQTFGRKPLLV